MGHGKLVAGVCRVLVVLILAGCGRLSITVPENNETQIETILAARETFIPRDAVKMTLEMDENPPLLYSEEFEPPVPVPGRVNTAGAEDAVFVTPDGLQLYFFFSPDLNVPAERQVLDGVTGLYVSQREGDAWGEPERILLQEPGKLALDGCEFVKDDFLWFCSTREGYEGIHWFTARSVEGIWQDWKPTGFEPSYEVGELHISKDGSELYFHSARPGGLGGLDIWVSNIEGEKWQEPINLTAVNTPEDDGWPALNPAEDELWITRNWGVWRSKKVNGVWQQAELVVSPLAGEASLDAEGNLYFIHHYLKNGKIVEADVFVAYKK
jgi:hypothetical protein